MLAGMKKCLLGALVFAVAFSYGAVYLLEAEEVRTLEDLYELARTHPDVALDKIPYIINANPELMNRCHEITHNIGHIAYSAFQERAFDFVRPMCGAGYLHGALEEAVTLDSVTSLVGEVHKVCKENQIEACLHGLGHAIFNVTQNTSSAIDLCKGITSEHTDCYDGVFMEQFDSESSPIKISYSDGMSVCLNMDHDIQASCFFYLPRTLKDQAASEVAIQCNELETPSNFICAQGSGVMFMKYERTFDTNNARSMCDAYVDAKLKQPCLVGVESYSQFGSLENSRWQ